MLLRLAHLSDLHIPPLPPPRWNDLVGKRLTGFLNWKMSRSAMHMAGALSAVLHDISQSAPDHVAITGDLVNLGLAAEYEPAARLLREIGPPDKVSLVAGNHDAYVAQTQHLVREAFEPYLLTRVHDRADPPWIGVRRLGRVALVGVDTALPTLPFRATGRVGAAQLAALAGELRQLRSEGLVRVVVMHHPPFAIAKHKRLTDGPAMLDLLREVGADLVLHGHTHHGTVTYVDGPDGAPIPVVGVPSASMTQMASGQEAAAWNLLSIQVGAGPVSIDIERRGLWPGYMRDVRRIFERRLTPR